MMDTERFELTDDEVGNLEWNEVPTDEYAADFRFVDSHPKEVRVILKAQVSKVLAMLEPVELEALGDEEIQKATNAPIVLSGHRRISQDTIQHNSKGQLFRLKEIRK